MLIFSGTEHWFALEDKLSTTTVFQCKPMFCSREYQHTLIFLQQNEKSTPNDSSNPSEIIPISFNTYSILEDNRNFDMCNNNDDNEKYLIQTCSQGKTSSTKLPEVYGIKNELDPNLRPEKQHAIPK